MIELNNFDKWIFRIDEVGICECRGAARYQKKTANFLAFVKVAAVPKDSTRTMWFEKPESFGESGQALHCARVDRTGQSVGHGSQPQKDGFRLAGERRSHRRERTRTKVRVVREANQSGRADAGQRPLPFHSWRYAGRLGNVEYGNWPVGCDVLRKKDRQAATRGNYHRVRTHDVPESCRNSYLNRRLRLPDLLCEPV
jgi:hypothetical protein